MHGSEHISSAGRHRGQRTHKIHRLPLHMFLECSETHSQCSRALLVSGPNQRRKVRRGSAKLQFSVFRSKIEFCSEYVCVNDMRNLRAAQAHMKCYVCQPAHPRFVFAGQALLRAILLELCRRPGHTACCAAERSSLQEW